MKHLDTFQKAILFLIPIGMIIGFLVFRSCWLYHASLGADFWARLGACS